MTINDFLVRQLSISFQEALQMIMERRVYVNGVASTQKQEISKVDQVVVDGNELQPKPDYRYILWYKPRGVECTMNPEIPRNLLSEFPLSGGLFPVGRLDKESEGLLLLTNDGYLYQDIAVPEQHQEKEYLVEVDKEITKDFLDQMESGVEVLKQRTKPAKTKQVSERKFKIILTQGLNRQIRRMCHKLGYEVVSLKRIRIAGLKLGNLNPGEYTFILKEDILIN